MVWGLIKVTLYELHWVGLGLAIGVVDGVQVGLHVVYWDVPLLSLIEIDWRKRCLTVASLHSTLIIVVSSCWCCDNMCVHVVFLTMVVYGSNLKITSNVVFLVRVIRLDAFIWL